MHMDMLQILRVFCYCYIYSSFVFLMCVCQDETFLFQHGAEHDTRIMSCQNMSDARNAKPKTRKKEAP